MENHTDNRPIGYWLRAVDRLLTREFAAAFASEDVSRREWMLLNVIDGTVDAPGAAERLQRAGKRLGALSERGWVTRTDEGWALTDEGRAAKERLGVGVVGIRSRVAGAVSPEDFATTLASLEAIARELGWDESEPLRGLGRRRGFGRRAFGRRAFGHDRHERFEHEHGHERHEHERHGHERHGHERHEHEHPRHASRFTPDHSHGHGYGHGDPAPEGVPCHGHRPHGHGHRHHEHGRRHGERAYERGFAAGFTRGAAARD